MSTFRTAALLTVGLLVASALTAGDAAAAAPPAQSTRVLPDVRHPSGAVGPDGSSLVFGEENSSTPGRPGLRLYYRAARGVWRQSTLVLPASGYPDADIGDTAVAAGPTGFFVLAWTLQTQGEDGLDTTVYAASWSATGGLNPVRKVYATTYPDQPGTPAAARLRIASNDNGDATLTQAEPHSVGRYLRGTGWSVNTLAAEPGQAPDNDATGEHKHGAVPMMSASRSVDVAYVYRAPGQFDAVRQVTRTLGANTLTARTLHTATDATRIRFGLARDSANRQTLGVSDAADAIVVSRESSPRGSFAYQFSSTGDALTSNPHVAARGKYTRVSWRYGTDPRNGATRLFDGRTWGRATATTTIGSDLIATPLVIGTDGRGVEASWYGSDGNADPHHAYRASLDPGLTTLDTLSSRTVEPPALDVGRSSVSQYVVREQTATGYRTVVRIRH